jgi:hypothetical protein
MSSSTSKSPEVFGAVDALQRLSFSGIYIHDCPSAGGAVIDEHDDEIISCRCFCTTQFLKLQDKRAVAIDARRASQE